ncbi:MAG: L,D-transpeptidase [Chloroflexi bacterium]|nr:L,D-transpeptidase [Chloroflexota bacterium]
MKSLLMILFSLLVTGVFAQGCPPQTHCNFDATNPHIANQPVPPVYGIGFDRSLLEEYEYVRVREDLSIYDAPDGEVVGSTGLGFTFYSVEEIDETENWVRIGEDQWLPAVTLETEIKVSRFAGVGFYHPPSIPMGWILFHLHAAEYPGGEPSANNPFLYRFTRINIYGQQDVGGYTWYQIGENQWVHQFNVAKVSPIVRPAGVVTDRWIAIDLYEQTLTAYEGNNPVFATLISSGMGMWPTREGNFRIYLRFPVTKMSGSEGEIDYYYLQDIPYTMYFDGDIALHGTYWHEAFGFRKSHGCVNLSVTDAKWLFDWTRSAGSYTNSGYQGASVYVYSTGSF